MKTILSTKENLELLFDFIIERFTPNENSKNIKITFKFKEKDNILTYSLRENQGKLELLNSEIDNSDLIIECSVINWLKLCSGRINPVISSILGKMKFIGNTKAISYIMNQKNTDLKIIKDDPKIYENNKKKVWKKPESVLIISGSPRGSNGHTNILLEKLAEGIKDAGSNCKIVILKEKNIKICSGCWNCWTITDGECIINDDMKELKNLVLDSDLLVYGFPIYFDGIPAMLKNFIDRQTQFSYPFMVDGIYKTRHPRRKPKEQYLLTLMTCGFMEIETFDPVKEHIKQICHNSHLGLLGHITFPEASHIFGDPTVYDLLLNKLDLIRFAGKEIILKGKIDNKILKLISEPSINVKYKKEWQIGANLFWQKLIDERRNDY